MFVNMSKFQDNNGIFRYYHNLETEILSISGEISVTDLFVGIVGGSAQALQLYLGSQGDPAHVSNRIRGVVE